MRIPRSLNPRDQCLMVSLNFKWSFFFSSGKTLNHISTCHFSIQEFVKFVTSKKHLVCCGRKRSQDDTLRIRALVVLKVSEIPLTYNHGQKSWDKFIFVALFHTRQTNSYTLVQPLPLPPSYNVGHVYTLFLQSFNIVLGGGRGGGGSNAF